MKGPVADRGISNIYMADYDGANQTRITVARSLDITPAWSPDKTAIAYTSYRTGFQDIIVSYISEGRLSQSDRRHLRKAKLPAGLVARRHAPGVYVESRRQQRNLRDQPRRNWLAPAHEPSKHRRHADLVAHRQTDRVHLRPHRFAADLDHE